MIFQIEELNISMGLGSISNKSKTVKDSSFVHDPLEYLKCFSTASKSTSFPKK